MKDKTPHLSEDQILLSLVDENDLSDHMKNHLLSCSVCQDKKGILEFDLERMGRMAKDFTPLPRKKPVLSLRKSRGFGFRLPVYAAGLAMVLIIAFLWGQAYFTAPSKQMSAQLWTEAEVGLNLIDDILEESAPPEYYLDIAVASYSYLDDEFLEFIVPVEEPDNSV
jgi:hypothetical protein